MTTSSKKSQTSHYEPASTIKFSKTFRSLNSHHVKNLIPYAQLKKESSLDSCTNLPSLGTLYQLGKYSCNLSRNISFGSFEEIGSLWEIGQLLEEVIRHPETLILGACNPLGAIGYFQNQRYLLLCHQRIVCRTSPQIFSHHSIWEDFG